MNAVPAVPTSIGYARRGTAARTSAEESFIRGVAVVSAAHPERQCLLGAVNNVNISARAEMSRNSKKSFETNIFFVLTQNTAVLYYPNDTVTCCTRYPNGSIYFRYILRAEKKKELACSAHLNIFPSRVVVVCRKCEIGDTVENGESCYHPLTWLYN